MSLMFAQIDSENIVENIILADSLEWCEQSLGGVWVETFGDGPQSRIAGIGYTYDSERNVFISPQPYPSWVFDEQTFYWNAPVERPAGDGIYIWDEDSISWVELKPPTKP
jgi:hypothetical protein